MNVLNPVLNPVSNFLKKNSKTINMGLIMLFIIVQLPIDSTFNVNIQSKIVDSLNMVLHNAVWKFISLILFYCMFRNGDALMMILFYAIAQST